MGGYGCGKTHLAAAIAHAVVGRGIPPLSDRSRPAGLLRYAYQTRKPRLKCALKKSEHPAPRAG
jgi:hypothetical protein